VIAKRQGTSGSQRVDTLQWQLYAATGEMSGDPVDGLETVETGIHLGIASFRRRGIAGAGLRAHRGQLRWSVAPREYLQY